MDLTSPDFEDGGEIPRASRPATARALPPSCTGAGCRAAWSSSRSTCEDPDVPGGTFVHCAAWGIDPAGGVLLPDGGAGIRHARNGFGEPGYGGPCPPPGHGPHDYEFTLYALDGSIDLEPGATIDDLRSAIDGHIRATANADGRLRAVSQQNALASFGTYVPVGLDRRKRQRRSAVTPRQNVGRDRRAAGALRDER